PATMRSPARRNPGQTNDAVSSSGTQDDEDSSKEAGEAGTSVEGREEGAPGEIGARRERDGTSRGGPREAGARQSAAAVAARRRLVGQVRLLRHPLGAAIELRA